MLLLVWTVGLGCSGGEDTGQKESESTFEGCGDPETYDIGIRAKVTRGGQPAVGIRVYLEERLWEPGILGEGSTDRDGSVSFDASPVTGIPNCWATAVDYWLVAEDGGSTVEDDMNSELYDAVDDGSLIADVSDRPLEF
jgi:hypothetical protein